MASELPLLDPLDEELLDDLVAAGLRFITSGGAGFDGVDIDYLTSKGVRIPFMLAAETRRR